MNLGGIIAGAVAGGADAAQQSAQGWIANEQKLASAREVGAVQNQQRLSLEQELSKIEEARQQRIAEAASKTRLAEKQAGIDIELANAPRVTAAEAERQRTVGGIKSEQEIATEGAKTKSKIAAELDANLQAASPAQLAAMRKMAAAKQAPERGSGLRDELLRLQIEDYKKFGNPARQRTDAEQKLYDEITETTVDPVTNSKTTTKRKVDPKAPKYFGEDGKPMTIGTVALNPQDGKRYRLTTLDPNAKGAWKVIE